MRRIFLVALLIVVACKDQMVSSRSARADAPAAPPPAQAMAAEEQAAGAPKRASAATAPTPAPARMIIRNANMSLVVRDAPDALHRITDMVEARGGYVGETHQWKERDQVRATASVRVPAAQLTTVLTSIRGLAIRVESEAITAQDVSQEYSDLGAQLRNLQATETELRELLKTVRQRTQKASEIMEIFDELTKVRGEIDQAQNRVQYLSQMTALSTITIELIPDVLAAPVVEPGWQPVATVKSATRSLVNTLKWIVEALIWIVVYMVPIVLVFMVLVMIVRAAWRRLRRSRKSA